MTRAEEAFQTWLKKSTDAEVNAQLEALKGDEKKRTNAFYKELEFGTGGLRGELGAGTNCLNVYTIRKVTQGVADCMKAHGYKKAAISYDSRLGSALFARTAAEVFAANGVTAYLTKKLMPTPFLSYITRRFGADIGVMITASHNPARYNGYKVYGADGCQLTDSGALEMTGYINAVDPFDVRTESLEHYLSAGLVRYVGEEITEEFLAKVFAVRTGLAEGLKVTYTPLNGTGRELVPEILRRMKVQELSLVPEQMTVDGNFPTCPYPNPEKAEALEAGLKYAEENDSDLLIATDPDCDRVGTAIRTEHGYVLLTGNEVGVLLADYLLAQKKAAGTLPKSPVIVKTIVTTDLVRKVAQSYGAEIYEVLTGFKYIGETIGRLEKRGEAERYLLGLEESYGYLSGTYVRDKDGVNAAMLVAEMAAHYKRQGKTLVDRINEIYQTYGLYRHRLVSYEFGGAEGNSKMKRLLESLRADLPKEIAGAKVVKTVDYLTQREAELPRANVLSFRMEDGSSMIVRPSGTEPLIKIYMTACDSSEQANEKKFRAMQQQLAAWFA